METLTNFIKWFDGKKTIIGGILLFIAGLFTDVLIGKLGLTDKWIIAAAEIMHYVGMGLAGVGLLHKGGKAVMPVAIVCFITFGMSSCVSMNSAINWAKKNGTVSQTTAPNGVVTTTAKVSNFYNPEKIKEKFSKFLVLFDAVQPSITLTTATKDTSAPIVTPTFKK